jgi:tryptophan synthase alpha chain
VLEEYIRQERRKNSILLMTHIIIGYPSLEESYNLVKEMVEAGVELIELQVPFSEPTADGPVIMKANQVALDTGITVHQALEFAERVSEEFPVPFILMTYYNIPYKLGNDNFVASMVKKKIRGAIVPDLSHENGKELYDKMKSCNIAPVLLFSPTTSYERSKDIAKSAAGFVYCVARRGVTGLDTKFSSDLGSYIQQCRSVTELPLAVGFGISTQEDVEFLTEKADIAVIGTQTIRILEKEGIKAVGAFLRELRPNYVN